MPRPSSGPRPRPCELLLPVTRLPGDELLHLTNLLTPGLNGELCLEEVSGYDAGPVGELGGVCITRSADTLECVPHVRSRAIDIATMKRLRRSSWGKTSAKDDTLGSRGTDRQRQPPVGLPRQRLSFPWRAAGSRCGRYPRVAAECQPGIVAGVVAVGVALADLAVASVGEQLAMVATGDVSERALASSASIWPAGRSPARKLRKTCCSAWLRRCQARVGSSRVAYELSTPPPSTFTFQPSPLGGGVRTCTCPCCGISLGCPAPAPICSSRQVRAQNARKNAEPARDSRGRPGLPTKRGRARRGLIPRMRGDKRHISVRLALKWHEDVSPGEYAEFTTDRTAIESILSSLDSECVAEPA